MANYVLILFLLALVPWQAGHAETPDPNIQRRAMTRAWNECGESFAKENDSFAKSNDLIDALNLSMHLNPPWRVTDAREPEKRALLIDALIIQQQLRIVQAGERIKLLEKIKKEDHP